MKNKADIPCATVNEVYGTAFECFRAQPCMSTRGYEIAIRMLLTSGVGCRTCFVWGKALELDFEYVHLSWLLNDWSVPSFSPSKVFITNVADCSDQMKAGSVRLTVTTPLQILRTITIKSRKILWQSRKLRASEVAEKKRTSNNRRVRWIRQLWPCKKFAWKESKRPHEEPTEWSLQFRHDNWERVYKNMQPAVKMQCVHVSFGFSMCPQEFRS